jgi:putative spermidine/putrescine transport system substrate-binding protein
VEFFAKLKDAGNFLPVDPTPATIASGQTPVVIDWDYTNAAQAEGLAGKREWKVVVPEEAVHGSYYMQAINADAPNPAAARLWQEFLYSDEGQNLWLKGFGRPGPRGRPWPRPARWTRRRTPSCPRSRRAGQPHRGAGAKAKEYLAANWQAAIS